MLSYKIYVISILHFLSCCCAKIYSGWPLKWANGWLPNKHRKQKQFQDNFLMCQVVWVHKLKNEKGSPVLIPNKMSKKLWISLMESYTANFLLMKLNWHIYDQTSSVRDEAFSPVMSFSIFNLFINFRDRKESQLCRIWRRNCGFSLSHLSFLAFLI